MIESLRGGGALHPSNGTVNTLRPSVAEDAKRQPLADQVHRGTGHIGGTVTSASGLPLEHVVLRLSSQHAGAFTVETVRSGQFAFESVPAGRYTLSAIKSGYVGLYYGQQHAFEPVRTLNVEEGAITDDIRLRLTRGGVIVGQLLDSGAKPVQVPQW
jgi:hypothetical protein